MKTKVFISFLLFWLFCPNLSASEQICTIAGTQADSLIACLPNDSEHFRERGVLYINQAFLNHSDNKKADADSAIANLEKALRFDSLPSTEAYLCIAKAVRAKEDGFVQKFFGNTKSRVTQAFYRLDTLAQRNPDDFTVQFLAANLFVEADRLDSAEYFWNRCLKISQALMLYCDGEEILNPSPYESFFDAEVRGTILLNMGKVELKVGGNSEAALKLAQDMWTDVKTNYKGTLAAKNAQKQLEKYKDLFKNPPVK
ncbi:MAG: hypothetical protein WCT08_00995 [Patescibacteria group bacterium]|jgi:tetratricopeptide (TPR) repeat protein